MKDEKYTPEVGTWLNGREVAPRDSRDTARRVAARLPYIRQRSRWWPLPLLYRRNETASTTDPFEHQPNPIPATNGHAPTVIGRIQSMLSPAKAIIAGALVLAIGGVMLVAQPIGQHATTVPAADGDAVSMDPAWVTGTLSHAPTCTQPERTIDGDVVHEVGYRCESQIWETDDPRLTGSATPSWNADVYRLGPDVSVSTGIDEVETDTGRWLCSSGPTVAHGSGLYVSTVPETTTCEGQDAYVGLAAVLDVDLDAGSVVGLVFTGELPPSPEAVGQ